MQSVPITTNILSSNPGEVYSIQLYVVKFDSDLRRSVVFSGYSSSYWSSRYNGNTVENDVKHHNTNSLITIIPEPRRAHWHPETMAQSFSTNTPKEI